MIKFDDSKPGDRTEAQCRRRLGTLAVIGMML